MKLGIAEILQKVHETKSPEQKIQILRDNDSSTLRTIIRGIFSRSIRFQLPKGIPPFKKNNLPDLHGVLYHEARRLYLFVEGGHPSLSQTRREQLFVELLEAVDAQDANILLAMKDKRSPFPSITKQLVEQAFQESYQ